MFDFSSLILLAQDMEPMPVPKSRLQWYFDAMGIFYAAVIPLSAFVLFLGSCAVVALAKRPAVVAAFLVFLPWPLLIGVHGTLTGLLASGEVIMMSPVDPRLNELTAGFTVSLVTTMVALMLSFPSYAVLSIGLFVKTILAGRQPAPLPSR